MTSEELDFLRRQASEDSMTIPMPTKAQLRELLAVFDAAAAFALYAEIFGKGVIGLMEACAIVVGDGE